MTHPEARERETSDICDVCNGMGDIPIYNNRGSWTHSLSCPECGGSGLSEEAVERGLREMEDRRRYEDAMAKTREARKP